LEVLVVITLLKMRVFVIHLAKIFGRVEISTDFLNFTPMLRVLAVGKQEFAGAHLGGTSKRALLIVG
jgi:hypothetical protein